MLCRPFQLEVLAWLACGGLTVPASAGVANAVAASEQEYRVTRWTAENELPQSTVKALAQTRDGYLWVGTLNGLARFDGVRFTVFDHSNTTEMTSDAIDELVADEGDGSLWIRTGNVLLRYRNHRFERYG